MMFRRFGQLVRIFRELTLIYLSGAGLVGSMARQRKQPPQGAGGPRDRLIHPEIGFANPGQLGDEDPRLDDRFPGVWKVSSGALPG